MKIGLTLKAKPHMFMPGETINAAIKRYNLYDVTKDEMVSLLEDFKKMNDSPVFKPGMRGMIPILPRHWEQVFNK
jgi:hypothetical protein